MTNKNISVKFLILACFSYFYIPCFLFLFGWLNVLISIPLSAAVLVALYFVFRTIYKNVNGYFEINKMIFYFVIVISFFIGFISGWAGYGYQTADWPKHNAIIHDLLEKDWPVCYVNGNEKSLLTYYIGQYLVPCFIGKILHLSFRNTLLVNFIYASIGLTLFIYLFIYGAQARHFRQQIFAVCVVILAGGLMVFQQEIGNAIYPSKITIGHSDWRDYFLTYGDFMLQFRTNFISLRWAFGQTLVPWMEVMLIYLLRKHIKLYLPLLLPALLFGTFSALSIFVIAFVLYVSFCIETKRIGLILKNTFSVENCTNLLGLGIPLFAYFYSYAIQDKVGTVGFSFVNFFNKYIGIYFIFILGSFLGYALLIFKEYKRNITFLSVITVMTVLPFFKFGVANDLLMGACIAPSMLLYLFCTQFLCTSNKDLSTRRKTILSMLLLIGMIKPTLEISKCLLKYNYAQYVPNDTFISMERFANRELSLPADVKYNYYTYDFEDSLFFKIMKIR